MSKIFLDIKFKHTLAAVILFCVLFFNTNTVYANQLPKNTNYNAAEKWVLLKVGAGEVADLNGQFKMQDDRVLHAEFLRELLLGNLITIPRQGITIYNAIIPDSSDFRWMRIYYPLVMDNFSFKENLDLSGSVFNNGLELKGSHFYKDLRFDNVVVQGHLNLDNLIIDGFGGFYLADISGNLLIDNAKFTNGKNFANFERIHVGNYATFNGTEFSGGVRFYSSSVGEEIQFDRTLFQSKDQRANFRRMQIAGDAFFQGAEFNGETDFYLISVGRTLDFSDARFNSSDHDVSFESSNIDRIALFNRARFLGGVNFSNSKIGNLKFYDTSFLDPDATINFQNISVDGDVEFNNAQFLGSVSFEDAKINGAFDFYSVKFPDHAHKNKALFNDMSVSRASFIKSQLPSFYSLSGMSYRDLDSGTSDYGLGLNYEQSSKLNSDNLLSLLNNANFSYKAYRTLERYFNENDNPEAANIVYVDLKQRERQEILPQFSTYWFWSFFLDLFFGYGRYPLKLVGWDLVLIILGSIVFDPSMMRPSTINAARGKRHLEKYNSLWYSLDLFNPFINLRWKERWEPKQNYGLGLLYMRIHIVLGWIMVPLSILSLSGLVR